MSDLQHVDPRSARRRFILTVLGAIFGAVITATGVAIAIGQYSQADTAAYVQRAKECQSKLTQFTLDGYAIDVEITRDMKEYDTAATLTPAYRGLVLTGMEADVVCSTGEGDFYSSATSDAMEQVIDFYTESFGTATMPDGSPLTDAAADTYLVPRLEIVADAAERAAEAYAARLS